MKKFILILLIFWALIIPLYSQTTGMTKDEARLFFGEDGIYNRTDDVLIFSRNNIEVYIFFSGERQAKLTMYAKTDETPFNLQEISIIARTHKDEQWKKIGDRIESKNFYIDIRRDMKSFNIILK
jgi:hypothetical protein